MLKLRSPVLLIIVLKKVWENGLQKNTKLKLFEFQESFDIDSFFISKQNIENLVNM